VLIHKASFFKKSPSFGAFSQSIYIGTNFWGIKRTPNNLIAFGYYIHYFKFFFLQGFKVSGHHHEFYKIIHSTINNLKRLKGAHKSVHLMPMQP